VAYTWSVNDDECRGIGTTVSCGVPAMPCNVLALNPNSYTGEEPNPSLSR